MNSVMEKSLDVIATDCVPQKNEKKNKWNEQYICKSNVLMHEKSPKHHEMYISMNLETYYILMDFPLFPILF